MARYAVEYVLDVDVEPDSTGNRDLGSAFELLADAAHEVLDDLDPAVSLSGGEATIEFIVDADDELQAMTRMTALIVDVLARADVDVVEPFAHVEFGSRGVRSRLVPA